jgi:hypothetical protein
LHVSSLALESNSVPHDHTKKVAGLNDETKCFIDLLYLRGIDKPLKIKNTIIANREKFDNLNDASITQIRYYLKTIKP